MRWFRTTRFILLAVLVVLGLASPAEAAHTYPYCAKRYGYASVQCDGVNLNMGTNAWRTDSAGHAYYIYTKTVSNVSMVHNYDTILCSDSWPGCRYDH